ncbi:kinase-like domain-containing protein [Armillaria fumosa]|nr:kinase-like domain-containing protein [Armillaria fumosa]
MALVYPNSSINGTYALRDASQVHLLYPIAARAHLQRYEIPFQKFLMSRSRLNPPPIVLRIAGPVLIDLQPFIRENIMQGSGFKYSIGFMLLENLMCDSETSWDLRSFVALVAAKIIGKGRLYPSTTFISELSSLLAKFSAKTTVRPASLADAESLKNIDFQDLKSPAESGGLGVSTVLTFRGGNNAAVKRAAVMQRSLSAMINLSVRNLTSRLTQIGEQPKFYGGSADIWRAHLTSSNGKVIVAVKRLRFCVTQTTKRLYQEIRIWQRLKHPHVIPLLGICHTVTSESIHASIEHLDPMTSIGITEQENLEELCLRLLIQVCSGLTYLHSKNIVHGDLHGTKGNILIDSAGCVRLADFGLSTVAAECRGTSMNSPGGMSSHDDALRWTAPELCLPGGAEARLHTSADMYSIGGLILQACTGDVPYSYYNDRRVLDAIIADEKPRRPTSDEAQISDALWSVIEECWQDDPLKRPRAPALGSRLQAIYSGHKDEQA